jgi:DnaJ-class molecular chaperone
MDIDTPQAAGSSSAVLMVLRGECSFEQKMKTAEAVGAKVVVVGTYEREGESLSPMGMPEGVGPDITIPAVMMSYRSFVDLQASTTKAWKQNETLWLSLAKPFDGEVEDANAPLPETSLATGHEPPPKPPQGSSTRGSGPIDPVMTPHYLQSFFNGFGEIEIQAGTPGREGYTQNKMGDVEIEAKLSLWDVMVGRHYDVPMKMYQECPHCKGRGAHPRHLQTCELCAKAPGQQQSTTRGQALGSGLKSANHDLSPDFQQQHSQTCPRCRGFGEHPKAGMGCRHCSGERVVMKVQKFNFTALPGTPDYHMHYFDGEGHDSAYARRGGIKATFRVEEMDGYARDGDDLLYTLNVTLKEALTGFNATVPRLNGTLIDISKMGISKPGERVYFKDEGFPAFRSLQEPQDIRPDDDDEEAVHAGGSERGYMVVTINVQFPVLDYQEPKECVKEWKLCSDGAICCSGLSCQNLAFGGNSMCRKSKPSEDDDDVIDLDINDGSEELTKSRLHETAEVLLEDENDNDEDFVVIPDGPPKGAVYEDL